MDRIRSIYEQTGWQRPYPEAILTRYELLCKITNFDFDLGNEGFQKYARSRGCLNTAFRAGSCHRRYVHDHWLTEADYLADNDIEITHAQIYEGKRHEYTESERHGNWQLIVVARAKLQDCWEVYNKTAAIVVRQVKAGQTSLFEEV